MDRLRGPGDGWLALLGGGEFSFGDTESADQAWLARCGDGAIGFLPAASGSTEYGKHFGDYLRATFERDVELLPIYRPRDARRGRNLERIAQVAAVYLGGGVADQLLDALRDSPALEALHVQLARPGGLVVAIAAAAQAAGRRTRDLRGGSILDGFGWLPTAVVEANFDVDHDRRLRRLLAEPGVTWGLGLAAGSAVLLGPDGALEVVGDVWRLDTPDGELVPLASRHSHEPSPAD
ncbi:MAG: Type 1 glutamine amidotransferase-like domain-containing protein [Acidobacteriota bacterium]